MPRLTRDQVVKIKAALLDENTTLAQLAKEFNCHSSTIISIKSEKHWSHVPFDPNDPNVKPQKTTSKLSVEDVRQIRERLSKGERYAALSKTYGVSIRAITDIDLGKTWLNVPWPEGYVRGDKRTYKLDYDQVKEIKALLAENTISSYQIAKQYGVTPGTIYKIRNGKLYRDV